MQRKLLICNSFVFYGSFYEAVSLLSLENQARVYDAIFKFAFENVETELEGVELAVFLLIKPQLLANRVKYENGCKGGRPRKANVADCKYNENLSETEIKPNKNLTKTETEPNENDNDNVNDICLLKELKEKMKEAGAYNGVHDKFVDEVLCALSNACAFGFRPRRYNGKIYHNYDFIDIADNLTVDVVCRVVNRLLSNAITIDNRENYILSVLASEVVI